MKTNEEKKVVTISENNRFHKARVKIGEISREHGKDVGVAAVTWAHATAQTKYAEELKAFETYVQHLQKQTSEKDNKVKAYFAGEALA